MQINPLIFKEYDIRGIYPEEINEEAIYSIAGAFIEYLDLKGFSSGPIIIGHDARISSPRLTEAFCRSVLDKGRDVIDIGLATTPLFNFSVGESRAAAGAIITASHNPPEYNGLKFVFEGPEVFSVEDYKQVYKITQKESKRKISNGKVQKKIFVDEYINFLAGRIDLKKPMSIVADSSNGPVGFLLEKLFLHPKFKELKAKKLFFEPDGNFPNHSPNPLKEEAQEFVKKEVRKDDYDLGCVFDGDADRIIFINERGETVRMDLITALLADNLFGKNQIVLVDLVSSKSIFDVGREKGINVERVKVGHANIKKEMKAKKADFAGELSGHYYYKEFYYSDSSLLTLVYVLNILSNSNKPFSEILEPYQKYFHSGEINFEIDDQEGLFEQLRRDYSDGKQSSLDGLTIEYEKWWFNIRPSKTEPVVRLVIEADKKELLEEKKKELTKKVSK